MVTKEKQIKELRDELENSKARGQEYQAELEFNQNEQQELEVEILSLETGVSGVGLPISTLIKNLEHLEINRDGNQARELIRIVKILALRLQRLEAIERRKR